MPFVNPQRLPPQYDDYEQDEEGNLKTGFFAPVEKDTQWLFSDKYWFWSLKAALSGGYLIVDNKTEEYKIKRPHGSVALMNQAGIEETMSHLTGFLTKNHTTGIIDRNEQLELCRYLGIFLYRFYGKNMIRFGIDSIQADGIIELILSSYKMMLSKSLGGTALRGVLQQTQIIEQIRTQGTENKGGILGFLRRV